MADAIIVEGEVTEDGRLILPPLPPDAPRGRVEIRISPKDAAVALSADDEILSDEELEALIRKYPHGMGLTAGEIAQSPEIGMWKDRTDIGDSVEFVSELRRQSRERRMKRD
jgi:hypothetical protein